MTKLFVLSLGIGDQDDNEDDLDNHFKPIAVYSTRPLAEAERERRRKSIQDLYPADGWGGSYVIHELELDRCSTK
jgi:hypothetical protein